MSRKLSFLYPITRVSSVVQLLKTTHYNAFPVVTPFNKFTKPPQNVSTVHVPVLYKHVDRDVDLHNMSSEPSVMRVRTTFKDHTHSTYRRRTQRRTTGESEEIAAQYDDENGLSYSYSVEASSSRAHSTERSPQQYLVLHGMILRSQLVTLIKNEVYFNENDQVRVFIRAELDCSKAFIPWISHNLSTVSVVIQKDYQLICTSTNI